VSYNQRRGLPAMTKTDKNVEKSVVRLKTHCTLYYRITAKDSNMDKERVRQILTIINVKKKLCEKRVPN
jgi:hypothetical protein